MAQRIERLVQSSRMSRAVITGVFNLTVYRLSSLTVGKLTKNGISYFNGVLVRKWRLKD